MKKKNSNQNQCKKIVLLFINISVDSVDAIIMSIMRIDKVKMITNLIDRFRCAG